MVSLQMEQNKFTFSVWLNGRNGAYLTFIWPLSVTSQMEQTCSNTSRPPYLMQLPPPVPRTNSCTTSFAKTTSMPMMATCVPWGIPLPRPVENLVLTIVTSISQNLYQRPMSLMIEVTQFIVEYQMKIGLWFHITRTSHCSGKVKVR